MREMKDSGIEWIGEIPKGWEIIRLKYITNSIGDGLHGTPNYDDLGTISFINGNNLGNRKISITEKTNRLTEEEYKKCGVLKLDKSTLLMSLNGTYGTLSMYDNEPIMLSKSVGYINVCNKETKEYLYYFLQSPLAQNQMKISLAGTTIANLSLATVRNLKICLPSICEQQQIADFLDTKCSEIDATAEDIQKEISLLEDYKKSVITEAVTKGLNPDAEMKDSGSEWIGEIPKDWEITKIGMLYNLRITKVSDTDYLPLSVTKMGVLPQLETVAKTNAHDDRKLVKKGDFVINSRSDRRGSCGISNYNGSVSLINIVLEPKNNMNSGYYSWLFKTVQFADEFYKNGHGIVDDLWTTGWQDMKRIVLPVPQHSEQQQITDFLDSKCSEIDSLIADKKRQLDILADYKKSLIYEYVTGKKEVPVNE